LTNYKKKIFLISAIILLIIIFFIFVNQILKISLEKVFSKWLKRDVQILEISKDFFNKRLILKNLSIKNINDINNHLFVSDIVIIEYDFKYILKGIILIEKLIVEESNLNIELFKINEKIYKDNIDIAEKITSNSPDKIWPKKLIDFNFVINLIEIINLNINISSDFSKSKHKSNFGKIELRNVGNDKSSEHYKDAFKKIMTFTVFNLKDSELKKKIKEIYKLD